MKKYIIIGAFVGLIGGFIISFYCVLPNTAINSEEAIYISNSDSFEDVLNTLTQKGILKNKHTFSKVAELKKYPSLIKPGKYLISPEMNNYELVKMLRSGQQVPVKFTFNNLRTLEQLASLLSQNLGVDSTEFMSLITQEDYVQQIGFTKENIIGMFIPNTYQFYWNTSADNFIRRMYKEYDTFWNPTRKQKAGGAGLSPMDIIIIASIVEEESIKPQEYPIIAGVYINRLRKSIPLAACPTIKYALGDFSIQRILKTHMTVDSPYNTYKYKGLPPGPVRMPSIQVIDAVLDYQKHDYLYFCAKSDFSGGHYFSKTLKQHNKYANEYHKALNKRNIYK